MNNNTVGGYKLGNITLVLNYKPKWIHRKMMSIFFGLKWVDELNNSYDGREILEQLNKLK